MNRKRDKENKRIVKIISEESGEELGELRFHLNTNSIFNTRKNRD